MDKTTIRPERDLYRHLMDVEKPGRYVGGEFGSEMPDASANIRVVICFPDLYEIGMSNLAVRILYQVLNAIDGVSCERVFAPAPDFESILRTKSIPLYSLESGTPLASFDIIGFSIGYELSATNVLNVLDCGGVPIHRNARLSHDPIILAGGPAVTNPAPFGAFFDAIYIGEIEGEAKTIFEKLVEVKKAGGSRDDLLTVMLSHDAIWSEGKNAAACRAVWSDFGILGAPPLLPMPSIRTAQDHGVVEIMRGCPTGCRFCHAGMFYRPFREKNPNILLADIEMLVEECGYREITISSLSTGDVSGVVPLVRKLNGLYKNRRISFSLPSLRVDSFTLPLLAEVSAVRKSGITFAVETPIAAWQQGLNKEVPIEKIVEIMLQAKNLGWRLAKFYFMLGLPVSGDADETEPIVDFLTTVQKKSGMRINVNVGTFVPKPHTPFQWSRQISEQQAFEKIHAIKNKFRGTKIQLKYNSPFSSTLEGIICRGSSKTASVIENAFRNGARMDAWEEYLNRGVWNQAIQDSDWDALSDAARERSIDENLPWDTVSLGVSKRYLARELERSIKCIRTKSCDETCNNLCGACARPNKVRRRSLELPEAIRQNDNNYRDGYEWYVDFSFGKEGRAIYLSHLNVMSLFERAFQRAAIAVLYTQGYNPKPRLEFASPLALGLSSEQEIARLYLSSCISERVFAENLNRVLHSGIEIIQAKITRRIEGEKKPKSLMSLYWGSEFIVSPTGQSELQILQSARNLLYEYRNTTELEDNISCDLADGSLKIRVRHQGKHTSIQNLLKEITPNVPWWYQWRVRRTYTFFAAENLDGYESKFS